MDLAGYVLAQAIQRAAAKKKGAPPRAVIETIIVQKVASFLKNAFPQIERLHLVGSRLRHREARDLDFIAVVGRADELPDGRMKTLAFGPIPKINVWFALPEEAEMHILNFGLGLDDIRWKRRARELGYNLNQYGLWRGARLVTQKMAEVAKILKLPLKPFLVATLKNPL